MFLEKLSVKAKKEKEWIPAFEGMTKKKDVKKAKTAVHGFH